MGVSLGLMSLKHSQAVQIVCQGAKQGNEDALRFVNKVLKSSDKD